MMQTKGEMERTDKIQSAFARLNKISYKVLHAADDSGACFKIPGLKNDDFNRAGIPSVTKLMRMDEVARGHNFYAADDSDFGGSGARLSLGLIAKVRVWTFTSELYCRAAINFCLKMVHCTSHIGRSSFDVTETFFEDTRDDGSLKLPLLSCVGRVVCVDTTTGRSTPLPTDLIQKLSINYVSSSEKLPTLTPPTSIPDKTFKWRVRVRYDDLDVLFHANQASFVLYCLECAAQAASQRYFTRIVEDVAFYPVRRVAGTYNAEVTTGDELDVFTWEDDHDKMRLHFVITKNKAIVYYGQIDFFDSVLFPSSL